MKHLANPGFNTVTIQKFKKLNKPDSERSEKDLAVIFLDVETTGLDFKEDRVIQICIRPVLLNPEDYSVTAVAKSIVLHQDPGAPLSDEIKKLTNINDDQLAGESIDWDWVRKTLERSNFVVCHNARFDRGMVESELARNNLPSTEVIWACSMEQVYWRDFCRPSRSLEVLCAWSGFFYDSHQAANDVDALIHVLRQQSKMQELIENASKSDYRIFAVNSPRDLNPELKKRKYRWDPNVSCWYKSFKDEIDAESEKSWLSELSSNISPELFEVEAKHRYSPE